MEPFIILSSIAVVVAVILFSFYREHKRTEALKTLATNWGFDYVGAGNQRILSNASDFDLFHKGRSRRIKNLMRGHQAGAQVEVFDYSFRTGSGKNSQTHMQTVVLITSEKLSLPYFMLLPENFLHSIGNFFGYRDIDFQDYPNFSKRYLLRGDDETQIRQVFDYRVIPWYEARQNVSTEGSGHCLMYYYAKRRYAPKNWRSLASEAVEAYQHFV
ncbi:MAG: hypothetical protein AAGH78_16825 [Cyanobacteria bacterium P01_H01_bin.58]